MKRLLFSRLIGAGLCLVAFAGVALTALPGRTLSAHAQTPPVTQSLSLAERTLVSNCAAVYRWQFGPQDATYLKIKGALDRLGGRSARLQEVLVFVQREIIQEGVAAGTFQMAKWLATCADRLTLPATTAPLRSSAVPEQPDPKLVSAMMSCLALQRWTSGPDTFETRDSMGVFAQYARKTGDAAEAEVRAAMDNLDKAIDGGLDPRVLMAAKPDCLTDFHVIINGEPDQRHSPEYMKAHPQMARVAPVAPAPSYSAPSASTRPDCDEVLAGVRGRIDPYTREIQFWGRDHDNTNAHYHMMEACDAAAGELKKSAVQACANAVEDMTTFRSVLRCSDFKK